MKPWIILNVVTICLLWQNPSSAQPVVKITNAEDSLIVKEQVYWYLDYFGIQENVFVSVIFAKRMPDKMEGMTYCLNPANPYPRLIIKVWIAACLNKQQRILVLAHEMIHVKQYVKGELKLLGKKKVMWKGRSFRNYYTGANRQLSPWEREAYRTDNLVAKLCEKQSDKPFEFEKPLTASKIDP